MGAALLAAAIAVFRSPLGLILSSAGPGGVALQRVSASRIAGVGSISSDLVRISLTSKMSETDTWRGAGESTIRDKYPASLHRFVRLCFHFLGAQFGRENIPQP